MRVNLNEDGSEWAEVAEPGELRRADKKAVLRVSSMEIDPVSEKAYVNGAQDDDMVDAMLARVVKDWSLPLPLPKDDPGSLGKLTMEQGDKLAAAVKPHMELILNRVDPAKKGTDPTAG